ncbi:MAG: SAM-dependent methyltransferase, partial [Marinobacter alexandrii]
MTLPPAASLHDPAESFYSHWLALNDWLHEHRGLWQPAPFMEPNPEWTRRYPGLARLIAEVSDEQCQSLE